MLTNPTQQKLFSMRLIVRIEKHGFTLIRFWGTGIPWHTNKFSPRRNVSVKTYYPCIPLEKCQFSESGIIAYALSMFLNSKSYLCHHLLFYIIKSNQILTYEKIIFLFLCLYHETESFYLPTTDWAMSSWGLRGRFPFNRAESLQARAKHAQPLKPQLLMSPCVRPA